MSQIEKTKPVWKLVYCDGTYDQYERAKECAATLFAAMTTKFPAREDRDKAIANARIQLRGVIASPMNGRCFFLLPSGEEEVTTASAAIAQWIRFAVESLPLASDIGDAASESTPTSPAPGDDA